MSPLLGGTALVGAGGGQREPIILPNPSGSTQSRQRPLPTGTGQHGSLFSFAARDDRPLPGGILHHVQAGEARPAWHRCHPLFQVHPSEVKRCGEPFLPVNKEISARCLSPGLAVPGGSWRGGVWAAASRTLPSLSWFDVFLKVPFLFLAHLFGKHTQQTLLFKRVY